MSLCPDPPQPFTSAGGPGVTLVPDRPPASILVFSGLDPSLAQPSTLLGGLHLPLPMATLHHPQVPCSGAAIGPTSPSHQSTGGVHQICIPPLPSPHRPWLCHPVRTQGFTAEHLLWLHDLHSTQDPPEQEVQRGAGRPVEPVRATPPPAPQDQGRGHVLRSPCPQRRHALHNGDQEAALCCI